MANKESNWARVKSVELQIMALKDAWLEFCKNEYRDDMFKGRSTGMRKRENEALRESFVKELVRLQEMKRRLETCGSQSKQPD